MDSFRRDPPQPRPERPGPVVVSKAAPRREHRLLEQIIDDVRPRHEAPQETHEHVRMLPREDLEDLPTRMVVRLDGSHAPMSHYPRFRSHLLTGTSPSRKPRLRFP